MIDDALIPDSAVPAVVRALQLAGVIAVSSRTLAQAALPRLKPSGPAESAWKTEQDEEAIVKALAVVQ